MDHTKMLILLLLLSLIEMQLTIASWPVETSRMPCKAKRTEIVFPDVQGASGRLMLSSLQDYNSGLRTFLHVTLKWRRRKVELMLYPNQVTSLHTYSEWSEGNVTFAQASHRNCLYHGYVKGQSSSYSAISSCDGLAGYIQTDEELLYIQPSQRTPTSDNHDLRAHILYTCESRHKAILRPDRRVRSTARHISRRRRSAKQPKYLEVMVAVDHTVVDEIGSKEKTQDYVMVLMNIANTVYQHHTLGIDIKVVVVKIIFLTKRQQGQVLTRNDPYRTVNQFCEWSRRRIPVGGTPEWDISVLITKEHLGPSGYAPITGLCNPVRSCAAVREEGFSTGFIIAHEMAHVFGLFHDGHGNSCHGRQFQNAMMASLVESKLNQFWWSTCSSRRMKEMVRYLHCLNNVPDSQVPNHYALDAPSEFSPKLGRPYSLDFQCSMEFGKQFRLCPHIYNDPCHMLWCSASSQPYMCRTKRGPPMPGSQCGSQRECLKERCQYVGSMRPRDGDWGAWSTWTDCSTACGVGIRRRSRVCDRPAPAYDGKECEGADSIWETCVNKTCGSHHDNRVNECAVWDTLQIRYGTHKWQPFETQNVSNQCKQTCKSSYTREVVTIDVHVTDGTPCTYTGNNSNICLDGECLIVGCDGEINSTTTGDMCGVCAGDSTTCKVVQGTLARPPKSGKEYMKVVSLPAGSRDIQIEETKRSGQFFALVDPLYGSYGMGGDRKQSKATMFVYAGAMFEYTESTANTNESLFCSGPIKTQIDVMLYPNSVLQNTSIQFKYSVTKDDFTFEKDKFKWKFKTWSECSVTCGTGDQTIIHNCVDKDSQEEVDDTHCKFLKPPRKDVVRCTREECGLTSYNFVMSREFGECDAKCGEYGLQKQGYYCERALAMTGEYRQVDMEFCDHLPSPNIVRKCQAPPCNGSLHFQWSVSENWSDCPCGPNNTQTRNVTCEKVTVRQMTDGSMETVAETNKTDCEKLPENPPTSRQCNGPPCEPIFQWIATDQFSACNASCGETGKQAREVTCQQVNSEKQQDLIDKVADQFCAEEHKPKAEFIRCKGDPCPEPVIKFQWKSSDTWSDCPCGKNNVQTRNVTCQKVTAVVEPKGKNQTIEDSELEDCAHLQTKPDTTRVCHSLPCQPIFRWAATESFGPCNASCGLAGQQAAIFMCEQAILREMYGQQKELIKQVDDKLCSKLEKPNLEIKTCIGNPCPEPVVQFQWLVKQNWSDCPCGKNNQQTRLVTCLRKTTQPGGTDGSVQIVLEEAEVNNLACADVPDKPATNRSCDGLPCKPKFRWVSTGRYGRCLGPCGTPGKRVQRLVCKRMVIRDGIEVVRRVHRRYCHKVPKPDTPTKPCKGRPCPTTRRPKIYRWKATEDWGKCNSDCGLTGNQTRIYSCTEIGQDGRVSDVSKRYCDATKLTPETRTCFGPPCSLQWSIGFWSQCSVTCGTGKRYRTVYCGDPNSDDDDYLCKESPPVTSKRCRLRACPNLRDEDCQDMHSYCSAYRALRYRCKQSRFRRKCCQTCQDASRSARRRKAYRRRKRMALGSYR